MSPQFFTFLDYLFSTMTPFVLVTLKLSNCISTSCRRFRHKGITRLSRDWGTSVTSPLIEWDVFLSLFTSFFPLSVLHEISFNYQLILSRGIRFCLITDSKIFNFPNSGNTWKSIMLRILQISSIKQIKKRLSSQYETDYKSHDSIRFKIKDERKFYDTMHRSLSNLLHSMYS